MTPRVGEKGTAVLGESRIVGDVISTAPEFVAVSPEGVTHTHGWLALPFADGWTWHPEDETAGGEGAATSAELAPSGPPAVSPPSTPDEPQFECVVIDKDGWLWEPRDDGRRMWDCHAIDDGDDWEGLCRRRGPLRVYVPHVPPSVPAWQPTFGSGSVLAKSDPSVRVWNGTPADAQEISDALAPPSEGTPANAATETERLDNAKQAALDALSAYTGVRDPEHWWNLNMPKALDIMLPAIASTLAPPSRGSGEPDIDQRLAEQIECLKIGRDAERRAVVAYLRRFAPEENYNLRLAIEGIEAGEHVQPSPVPSPVPPANDSTGDVMFVLPTYGMPCCGHRIVQHEPDDDTGSRGCRCCATGAVPTSALVLIAESPAVPIEESETP